MHGDGDAGDDESERDDGTDGAARAGARLQPRDPFGGEDGQREQIHHQRARRAAQRAVERHVVEEEAMHRRAVAEREQDAEDGDAAERPQLRAAVARRPSGASSIVSAPAYQPAISQWLKAPNHCPRSAPPKTPGAISMAR